MEVRVAGPSASLPPNRLRVSGVNSEGRLPCPPRRVFYGEAHGKSRFSLGCQEWKTLWLWTPRAMRRRGTSPL